MQNNKPLIVLVSFMMLLNSVYTVSFSQGGANNPICSTGNPTLTTSQLDPGSTTPDFDYASSFYNVNNGDTMPLFVKKGDANQNLDFNFISFDADLGSSSKTQSVVTDSKTFTYVKLVNQFLFLKDTQSLYMYMYGGGRQQTITFPSGYDINDTIMPYYSTPDGNGFRVYIGMSDSDSTDINYWTVSASGVVSSEDDGTPVGDTIRHQLTKIYGTGQVIYDHYALTVLDSVTAPTKWSAVGAAITFTTTNPTVKIFSFANNRGVLTISQKPAGGVTTYRLYSIEGAYLSFMESQPSEQAVAYYYYDEGKDFVRIFGGKLTWIHLKPNTNSNSLMISQTTQFEDGVSDVALSGNKMALLYNSASKNYVAYYRILSDGGQHLFNIDFDKTVMVTTGTSYQYKLGLACSCGDLQRFTCFSSTLNCIIVKKALGSCKGTDNIGGGAY